MKMLRFILLLIVLFTGFSGGLISSIDTNQPSTGIVKGGEVPVFEIILVNSEGTLTKDKLLGKVYLLDFWMTSCRKCIDKMAFLHDLHEKYRDKDFEIISISSDNSFEAVEVFRRERWKMPWLHGWALEGDNRRIAVTVFEVTKLPKLVLVDGEGKIVCTNYETDEAGFEKALKEMIRRDQK